MKHGLPLTGIIVCLLLAIFPGRLLAEVPKYEEQFVYHLRPFDGKGYPETFIPQQMDTIYMLADTNNIISARVTLVYFWPLTGKFVATFKQLNEPLEGTLEIFSGSDKVHQIGQSEFVLFYPKGSMGEQAELHVGKDAYALFKEHEQTLNDFYDKFSEYNKQMLSYKGRLMAYAQELEKRKELGETMNPEQVQANMPRQPVPPDRPPFDITGLQSDFVVDLAPGNYRIRFKATDGTIVEGSEKKLVVFSRRRVGGVGYEIIPGNRWTKRESSNEPSQKIYGTGNNKLYFRAFMEDEYNELFYKKMLDPQSRANPLRWIWVHMAPLLDRVFTIQHDKSTPQQIKRSAYLVKQEQGARLGYEILPYTPERFPDKQPAFEGYEVEFSASRSSDSAKQTIWLEDSQGRQTPNSRREMIPISRTGANWLYLISTFPLVVGLLIYLHRRRVTT